MLSYYILIGDFTTEAIYGLNPDFQFEHDRQIYITVTFLVVLLPLSLLKEFKSIQLTSMIGNVSTTYAVILVVATAVTQMTGPQTHSVQSSPTANSNGFAVNEWNLGLLIVTNVVSKACVSQYAIPPMYQQLKHRNIKNMRFVIIFSYSLVSAIYLLFAIAGYITFGDGTQSDIFNNYQNDNVWFIVARLGWNLSLIGSYPVAFKSCLQTIEDKCFNPKRGNRWNFKENPRVRIGVILGIALVLLTTSLVVENVGPVSSVEGAVTILCLICIFPILMAWKIGMVHHEGTETKQRGQFLFGLQVMLVVGIVLGTGGIAMQLLSL